MVLLYLIEVLLEDLSKAYEKSKDIKCYLTAKSASLWAKFFHPFKITISIYFKGFTMRASIHTTYIKINQDIYKIELPILCTIHILYEHVRFEMSLFLTRASSLITTGNFRATSGTITSSVRWFWFSACPTPYLRAISTGKRTSAVCSPWRPGSIDYVKMYRYTFV